MRVIIVDDDLWLLFFQPKGISRWLDRRIAVLRQLPFTAS